MDNSEIVFSKNGKGATTYAGRDAVGVFAALTLWSAIGLLQKGIQPTRGYTMKKALAAATAITQKPYKRTESEQARQDVKKWADEMKAAIPQIVRE
jgi:hypothetical protein